MVTLICRTYTRESVYWCPVAVIFLTGKIVRRVDELREREREIKQQVPDLCYLSAWDDSVDFLESVPQEWDEWVEDLDYGEWVRLPFPYGGYHYEVRRGCNTIKLSCAENQKLVVDDRGAYWVVTQRDSSENAETPRLPDLSDLERLALVRDDTTSSCRVVVPE